MKNYILNFVIFLLFVGCNNPNNKQWISYDESSEIKSNQDHDIDRMQFKLIQSKVNLYREIVI